MPGFITAFGSEECRKGQARGAAARSTRTRTKVLDAITARPANTGASANWIRTQSGLSATTVRRVLRRLIAEGTVSTRRGITDGRTVRYLITEADQ